MKKSHIKSDNPKSLLLNFYMKKSKLQFLSWKLELNTHRSFRKENEFSFNEFDFIKERQIIWGYMLYTAN